MTIADIYLFGFMLVIAAFFVLYILAFFLKGDGDTDDMFCTLWLATSLFALGITQASIYPSSMYY
jgi:hypothetical protein